MNENTLSVVRGAHCPQEEVFPCRFFSRSSYHFKGKAGPSHREGRSAGPSRSPSLLPPALCPEGHLHRWLQQLPPSGFQVGWPMEAL